MTENKKKDSEGETVRQRESGVEEWEKGREREKQCVMYKGNPIRLLDFSADFVGQKRMIQNIQNAKKNLSNHTPPGKLIIQNWRQFSRKADLKELITTESALQEMEKDYFNEKEGHWLLTRKHMEEYTSLER